MIPFPRMFVIYRQHIDSPGIMLIFYGSGATAAWRPSPQNVQEAGAWLVQGLL